MRTPQKLRKPPVITDDRALIEALGMSEAEVASHLFKTRQSINAKLGTGQPPLRNYFRTSDLLTLVNAARHVGRDFDAEAVSAYVSDTRGEPGGDSIVLTMLYEMLGEKVVPIDVAGARGIVFILPGFTDLATHKPQAFEELRRISEEIRGADVAPKVFVLSSTELQARMAAQSLDLVQGENFFGRDIVDHYLPMILVYRGAQEQQGFVLTEANTFVEAPYYRLGMATACVLSLLPEVVAGELRSLWESGRESD